MFYRECRCSIELSGVVKIRLRSPADIAKQQPVPELPSTCIFPDSKPNCFGLCSVLPLSDDGTITTEKFYLGASNLKRIREHLFPGGAVPPSVMSDMNLAQYLVTASGITESCYQKLFVFLKYRIQNIVKCTGPVSIYLCGDFEF